jgi:hypothetical protein
MGLGTGAHEIAFLFPGRDHGPMTAPLEEGLVLPPSCQREPVTSNLAELPDRPSG